MAIIILFLIFFISALLLSSLFQTGADRRRPPLHPGPKGWPLLGNLLQLGSKPHQTLETLSNSHGSVGLLRLRFGTVDVIIISSASAAKKCFRSHDASLSSRPPNSVGKYITYNFEDLVMVPYGPWWQMLRKLCTTHLFSNKMLDSFQHVREEEAARLVRDLVSGREAAVDVGGVVNTCVTNVLSRVLFGRRVIAGVEEAVEFKEMAAEITRLAGQFNIGDFLPGIDWLDLQGLNKQMTKIRERFGEFLEKIIEDHRLKRVDGDKDFLSVLLEMKGNVEGKQDDLTNINIKALLQGLNKQMTKIRERFGEFLEKIIEDHRLKRVDEDKDFLSVLLEMKGNIEGKQDDLTNINIKALLQDMFIAGTDTTSITLEWILAELIRHPHLLARAQHELDSIVGRHRLIFESDLPKLPFLHAFVKETLRLHPAVPLSVPRMTIEDCVIDGYLIPKGVTLFVNIWAIGRDPVSWPDDPYAFNPDRFVSGSLHESVDVTRNDFELIPFGAGRRICAGMNAGLRIVHVVAAILLHAFDWRLADGEIGDKLDMEESYGATMRKKSPLKAKAVPRLAPEAYL